MRSISKIILFTLLVSYELASSAPTLEVDINANRHPISDNIYGLNFWTDEAFAKEIRLPFNRFGGNVATRYNWKIDADNRGADYFFESLPEGADGRPEGAGLDEAVQKDKSMGARSMMTIPLIGWTAKDRQRRCGFSVAKYGPQQKTDKHMPDCGNGIRTDGTHITWNDPTDTSMRIDPSFAKGLVQHFVNRWGTAASGGVLFYEMDNEYDIWQGTHRDLRPNAAPADEIIKLTLDYASVVKEADPTALVLGPVGSSYQSFLKSASDIYTTKDNKDRLSHGNIDFAAYYLKAMKSYQDQKGKRILDYLDYHFYPQPQGVFSDRTDSELLALRLRCTRALWDPTYEDESWYKDFGPEAARIQMIPRMRRIIDQYYPGTKIAVTEYSWGGLTTLNGALAQADVLGIFGREGVDLASLWGFDKTTDPWAYAFRMYRNYDGQGSRFGDYSVQAQSSDQGQLAVYASLRSWDQKLVVIVINKDQWNVMDTQLTVKGTSRSGMAKVFTYSNNNLGKIVQENPVWFDGSRLAYKFQPYSITLFEI